MVVVICAHNHHACLTAPVVCKESIKHHTLIDIVGSCIWLRGINIFACASSDDITSPGIVGGIFICLGILFLNAFQLIIYRRMLNHHRCSQCGSLSLKIVGKNVEGYKKTCTTHYINNQTNDEYHKSHTHIHTKTTFLAYCPDCNSLLEWVEEDDDHGEDSSSDNNQPYDYPPSRSCSSSSEDCEERQRQRQSEENRASYERQADEAYSHYQSYISQAESEESQAETELRYAEDYEYRAREYGDDSARSQASSCRSNARYNQSRAREYRSKADYYYGLYQEYKDRARSC